MSAPDAFPSAAPARSTGPSLHGNDNQVVERRSLRDYYIIIRERLWIALPVALLVALSVGYYQAQETPMYSSTATMQFERPDRGHHQLLHCSDLAFADDRHGREQQGGEQQNHRDHTGNVEIAALQVRIEPGARA